MDGLVEPNHTEYRYEPAVEDRADPQQDGDPSVRSEQSFPEPNVPGTVTALPWWKHEPETKSERISWNVILILNIMRNIPNSYFKLEGFEERGILRLGNAGIGLFMIILFTRTVLISATSMNDGRGDVNRLNRLAIKLQKKIDEFKTLSKQKSSWKDLTDKQQQLLLWLYQDKIEKLQHIFSDNSIELPENLLKFQEVCEILNLPATTHTRKIDESEEAFNLRVNKHRKNLIKCLRIVLQSAMRSTTEIWFTRFIYLALVVNALVYSLFAAKSCYTFVMFLATLAGVSSASIGAIVPAIMIAVVFFIVSMIGSCYLTGSDIERDCMTFCDFWTLPVKKFEWKHVVYLLASITTVATAALMYDTLSTTLVPLLIATGCNPFGALMIAGILVTITVIGSVKFICSAVRSMREEFKDKLWRDSEVYQNYKRQDKLWLYWTMVGVGSLFSAAVILVGMLGDVYGIAKLFPEKEYIATVVISAVAVLSFFCNLLQNVDFLHRFPSAMQLFSLKSEETKQLPNKHDGLLQRGLFAAAEETSTTSDEELLPSFVTS